MAHERIPAIDDDPAIRTLYERALPEYGYEARVVGDTTEALQILTLFNPDVIISDKEMNSVMSGIDFFAYLEERNLWHGAVKYLISGSALTTQEIEQIRRLDIIWLCKPIKTDYFERIRRDLEARVPALSVTH